MTPQQYFNQIMQDIPHGKPGKMFGAHAIKLPNGKAGAMLKEDMLLVKRSAEQLGNIAQLSGVQIFTPKPGRPMNGWFQIPYTHKQYWPTLIQNSCADIAKLEPNKK